MPLPTTDLPPKLPSQSYEKHQAAPSGLAALLSNKTYPQRPTEALYKQDVERNHLYNSDEDENEQDHDSSPLLRHESLVLSSVERSRTPFRGYEPGTIGDHSYKHPKSLRRAASPSLHQLREATVASEADPNDPSLERFPTDYTGITEHIRRLSTKVAYIDEENAEDDGRDRTALGATALSSFVSLPNVREDDGELDKLRDHEHKTCSYDETSTHKAQNRQPKKAPSVSRLPSLCGSSPSISEDDVCQQTHLQHKSLPKEVVVGPSHRINGLGNVKTTQGETYEECDEQHTSLQQSTEHSRSLPEQEPHSEEEQQRKYITIPIRRGGDGVEAAHPHVRIGLSQELKVPKDAAAFPESCDQVHTLGLSVPPPTAYCTPPEYVYEDVVDPDFSRELDIAYSASITRDGDRCHRYGADVSELWKRGSTPEEARERWRDLAAKPS